jgi:2-polyprenyl-3-methyl-5-hydroxy-6-metoxy-1,4-benzoquinol methylase
MKEVRGENYYDDKVWATERIFKKVESLIPFKYGTALDLGCGQGNLSKMIHSKGYSILGVDIENFLKFDDIEFKKRDLIKNFPEIKDKVEVIYPAIPEIKNEK